MKVRINVEHLEDRTTPAVVRSIDSFVLVSETRLPAPNPQFMAWTAEDKEGNRSEFVRGSVTITLRFTKGELAEARSADGIKVREEIRWREDDEGPLGDDNIKTTNIAYTARIPANADSVTLTLAPPDWHTRIADHTDFYEGEAEFYGWLNDPDSPFNFKTPEIWIWGDRPGGLGGAAANGFVQSTPGVGFDNAAAFANPALPVLAPNMQQYRVLSLDSTNGNDLIATAANTTGYSLLAASSNSLVWDANLEDSVIPNTTTFTTAYGNGAQVAGAWNGGETAWVVRDATGTKTFHLTSYTYTKVPASFVGLADGQSTSVSVGSLESGVDALWLTFETDGESVSFLIIGANGSTITGRVWDDTTQNGIQDAGETGRAGVQVQLLDANLNVVGITFTDASGNYTFSNLAAGQYRLRVIAPPNYTFAPKDAGPDSIDSDFDAFGYGDIITTNGGTHHDFDAGLWFSTIVIGPIGGA